MALALVPRARGRGEKTANFWQKSSTFDPISEGTRRKKTAAGTTGRWIDMRFSKPPGFFPDKLIGYWIEHRASSIEPLDAARDPIRLGHRPSGKGPLV